MSILFNKLKTMKLKHLLCIIAILPTFLFAQGQEEGKKTKIKAPIMSAGEKRIKVAVEGGYYRAINYDKITPGWNIGLDLEYMINGQFSVINFYNFGKNRYFEGEKSNNPSFGMKADSTNADISTIHAGFMVGYTVPLSRTITFSAALGISVYNERLEYPVLVDGGLQLESEYKKDARILPAIPVKVGFQYIAAKWLDVGIAGGLSYCPGQPIIGLHFGPELTFKF